MVLKLNLKKKKTEKRKQIEETYKHMKTYTRHVFCLGISLSMEKVLPLVEKQQKNAKKNAHLVEGHVDPGVSNAGVGGLSGSLQQRVELGVEAHGPRAVDDAALHLSAEVHLHHVSILTDKKDNIKPNQHKNTGLLGVRHWFGGQPRQKSETASTKITTD